MSYTSGIVTVWILAWSGYIGVDGKTFSTLEDCRSYAFERIAELKVQNEDFVWQCIEREARLPKVGPHELRPRRLK